jgi:hypothetical protein
MTHKTHNRLMVLGLLALPFLVLFGFVISEAIAPLQPPPDSNGQLQAVPQNSSAGTNTVYSPR